MLPEPTSCDPVSRRGNPRRDDPQRRRARDDAGAEQRSPSTQVGAAQQWPPPATGAPVMHHYVRDQQRHRPHRRTDVELHREQPKVGPPTADSVQQPTPDRREHKHAERQADHLPRSSWPPKTPPRDKNLGRGKQQQPQSGRPMHRDDPPRGDREPHAERHDATDSGRHQERQQRDVERSRPSIHVVCPETPTNSDH
jgi:hypothetical protein